MSFTTGNDINILQGTSLSTVGAGEGNDRYVLDASTLNPNQRITLSDTLGNNTLQLAGGLVIVSSLVANDSLQLTLNNNVVITVLGASNFSFQTGGNGVNGTGGITQNYATFVTSSLGLTGVPASGAAPAAGGMKTVADTGGTSGSGFLLTTGFDNLFGTAGIDTFTANVVQNIEGFQTNQLATGDRINGGALVDTLNAVVQRATALGNTTNSAITPVTTSVEQTFYTALTVDNNVAIAGEQVVINAKSQTGLTKVGSVQSDASLLIQNLTTLTDSLVYTDRRNTDSVAIKMDFSGNANVPNKQSDLTVLFDNDYLVSTRSSISSVGYFVEDRESAKINPAKPLVKIDATGITFTVNGIQKSVVVDPTVLLNFRTNDASFLGFATILNAQLQVQKLTDPSLANLNITLDTNNLRTLGKDQTTLPVPAPAITLTSSVGETLVAGGFTTKAEFGVTYDVFTDVTTGIFNQTIAPVTSNIELTKVGRGAEGGSLVVGGMATDLLNNFKFSNVALKEGVEQFNILVSGDTTQPSSLSNLSSTNNTLRTVNVTYATGSLADLNIGNKNTTGILSAVNGASNNPTDGRFNVSTIQNLALKDVLTFSAANSNSDLSNPRSPQTNDVILNAYLSDQVVVKYMNRLDNVGDPTLDNANFVYTTGAGNDVINMNISKTNLAESGNATREDFTLSINAGNGDNTIQTQIGDGTGITGGTFDPWYINQTIQKNLFITTGANNDSVRVNGAGSWNINTGAGNDVIYSDGSGRQNIDTSSAPAGNDAESNAIWVFNTANQTQALNNAQPLFGVGLTSALAVTNVTNVANISLTVSYRGLTTTVPVGNTADLNGGTVNDLIINQAIKAAINNDPYLKNLLVAQDGTGRTLVVTSLTDGVFNDNDLSVALGNAPLTPQQAAVTVTPARAITSAELASLGFGPTGTAIVGGVGVGRFDSAIADDLSNVQIVGSNSTQPNANVIEAGTGTDTVVLSTSPFASERVTVANVIADKDVVFNAGPGAVITVDSLDIVISTSGLVVAGGAGSVTFIANGITGTAGNDNINASNATAGQTINGGDGNDTIVGSAFNDNINGGNGSDVIALGGGNDILVFSSLVGSDTISDFSGIAAAVAPNTDKINVSKATFAAIAAAGPGPLAVTDFVANATGNAAALTDRFIFNTVTGALNYDADGTGVGPAILVGTFSNLANTNALQNGDFAVIA